MVRKAEDFIYLFLFRMSESDRARGEARQRDEEERWLTGRVADRSDSPTNFGEERRRRALALYVLPGIIAFRRKSRSAVAITFLNFFFGWTGVGWLIALLWALWREKPLPEGAPKPSKLSGFLKATMIGLILMPFGCPYVVTGMIARDAARLIPLRENYKAQRGVYPKGLEELEVSIQYDDRGIWGMRYGVGDDGKEFWLACYSITPSPFQLRRVYRSATRNWETID